jgi:P4 family phage/plasmid primase-like protien
VDHRQPHGSSRELVKTLLAGRSRGIFNGKVIVRKDAQKTDAQQKNENLLLGPGANGKTVLLAIIRRLLGERNVSAIPLQAFSDNRFAAAELFGKLANVCGDLDARTVRHSDVFKAWTGGDLLLAERKYGAPFAFCPTAVPIFSANEPPLSSDQSDAWFDRWLIVPMERRIPEDQRDPHLARKLVTEAELEGLLVEAVEGLERLMRRGRFDLPESVRRAGEGYRDRLDTVRGFVGECCHLDPDLWTPRPVLYAFYRDWAKDGGRFPVSAATFFDHLRRGFAGRIEERTRRGKRGWLGIGLGGGEDAGE